MKVLIFAPLVIQTIGILIDEFYFHWRRDLPKWERWGHPIDTLSLGAALFLPGSLPFGSNALHAYVGLSILSSLLVTKDEWVHIKVCTGGEMWVHALLFIVHPLTLISVGLLWRNGDAPYLLRTFWMAVMAYAVYQAVYWNVVRKPNDEARN